MDTITPELTVVGDSDQGYAVLGEGSIVAHFEHEHEARQFMLDERRRALDPEPWIKPATMERFAEEPLDGFSVYRPRTVWPQHGGRMVRRDYLRPGDCAVSSHFGPRTVASVQLAGAEGQTTVISWVGQDRSERYDSSAMIELLPTAS